MDKYQALVELLKDEDKVKEIISDSTVETQQNLKKYGLDFTIEELEEIAIKVAAHNDMDELGEDSLEDVSGGVAFSSLCAAALISYGISAYAGLVKKWLNRK